MTRLVLLGSTGSIGTQTLDVVRRCLPQVTVYGLAAGGRRVELLAEQIKEFHPQVVAVADASQVGGLRQCLEQMHAPLPEIWAGAQSVEALAGVSGVDIVLNSIDGASGLPATLAALAAGSRLALANKESLVVGGAVVKAEQKYPGQVLPVDSEHSAIWQTLSSGIHHRGMCSENIDGMSEVRELILTASGGPFRGKKRSELQNVTAAQALKHPTWSMGPVVTINSSTLFNKALEIIEAHLLFDIPTKQIRPVIHPQSIVHSGVTWQDGASILQASRPDMRIPIARALSYPQRVVEAASSLDFAAASTWEFEPVDNETFPAIDLACAALAASQTHPAVLNAANEVCVAEFLRGNLPYLGIVDTLQEVLAAYTGAKAGSVADVLAADTWARAKASDLISKQ